MSLLKSNIVPLRSRILSCPHCRKPQGFSLFCTSISPAVKNIPLYPFRRRYAAICKGCKKLFYIDKAKGDSLIGSNAAISEEDLKTERE